MNRRATVSVRRKIEANARRTAIKSPKRFADRDSTIGSSLSAICASAKQVFRREHKSGCAKSGRGAPNAKKKTLLIRR